MNRAQAKKLALCGYTLVEMLMAGGVTSLVMAGLVAGSVALLRSFVAITDYATAEDDQQRISDYLAVDMRRSTAITTAANGVVTITLPNYYDSNGKPNPPTITNTMGWPQQKKKEKKHKHRNIIIDQTATYNPASTQPVKYYKGAAGLAGSNPANFYREVNGVATAIATDVADFNVTLSDDKSMAKTQITFTPRFHFGTSSNATTGTTLYQTTLLRNYQD